MPPQPNPSIKELVSKTVADAQRLAKAQMALLQTEVSATGAKVGKGGALGIVAATMAIFGLLFILLTLAFVIVALGLPIWAGMLIIAGLLIIVAAVAGLLAKREFDQAKGPEVAIAEFEKTKAALSGQPVVEQPALPSPPGS
jgi:ABC-type multidrug transport system permease subunit